ncbi:MAG: type II toxin-antitoxin system VapC family toxin [Opitutaceae bacterium]
MKHLLDVNALIAWHHPSAPDHADFHAWRRAHRGEELISCAITELGFLRVSMQAFRYTAAQAQTALESLRRHLSYAADLPPPALPGWSNSAARTTDAYLAQVAAAHGALLATFDAGIPGATLIVP